MVLWFAGTAFLTAWLVFRDPSFDYRLVMLGAVLPDAVDACFGGAAVMHSVVTSVVLLVVVMLVTIHRRSLRRHLIALPDRHLPAPRVRRVHDERGLLVAVRGRQPRRPTAAGGGPGRVEPPPRAGRSRHPRVGLAPLPALRSGPSPALRAGGTARSSAGEMTGRRPPAEALAAALVVCSTAIDARARPPRPDRCERAGTPARPARPAARRRRSRTSGRGGEGARPAEPHHLEPAASGARDCRGARW